MWGDPTTLNSLAWAIEQSNTTPGADIIQLQLRTGSSINVDNATPVISSFLSRITESVQINGNGVTLLGNPLFIGTNGIEYNKFTLSSYTPTSGDVLVTPAFSFAEIGPSVSVGVKDLNIDGLNGFLSAGTDSVVTVINSAAKNTVPYGFGGRPVFEARTGATLNLHKVVLDRINPLENLIGGAEFAWVGAIAGGDATLNMTQSIIKGTSSSIGGVNWIGGAANIVSSIFTGSAGGLSIAGSGAVMNIVNSLFVPDFAPSAVARIQAFSSGVANLIASTVQANALLALDVPTCSSNPDDYACNGVPLQAFDAGSINLFQSVVSTINSDLTGIIDSYSEVFDMNPTGDLVADAHSYVQPTPNADAADLKLLFNQPSLLTGSIPYELTAGGLFYADLPDGAALLPGSPLRSAIADAEGANQLINPIDGSVITTDVYGNPRTAFGRRDIGAVQSTQEVPGPLPSLGVAAAFRWSRRLRKAVRSASC
jgi:hypothetical protein